MIDLNYAREVIRTEAKAVEGLAEFLDANFEKAVRAVLSIPESGRFIISGMGKPGYIAQKISATLASTGTPSYFLHPAEALHGDAGRIRKDDVVLLISNSGETAEILSLIDVLKKIGCTTISMTASLDSNLAKHCDIKLSIGKISEACPMGLAPSATTTAMLALGDALALTILKARDFGPEEYAACHPAGMLGRKLMKVREVMRGPKHCPLIAPDLLVRDALLAMTKVRSGAALIVNSKGMLEGIFTDGDLRRNIESHADLLQKKISDVMTPKPVTVKENQLATEAIRYMKEKKIDEIVVLEESGRVAGLLDIQDLLAIGLG